MIQFGLKRLEILNKNACVLLISFSFGILVSCKPDPPPPPIELATQAVGCKRCHDDSHDDPTGVHSAERVPCQLCHLGDPRGTDELTAHRGLEREPGALDTIQETCGLCHQREAETVLTSPMADGRGLIAVNRWAFGEIDEPNGTQNFHDLLAIEDPTPAEDHLRRLCAGCHLGTRRDNRDDAVQNVGSGCGSCHVATDYSTTNQHPTIDQHIPSDRCLGCHSRSARISLSYQGLAEISGAGIEACENTTTLFDGRQGCILEADVHHQAGLDCTDCHIHTELMGDGHIYEHEQDALEVQCESCHGPTENETSWAEINDPITTSILQQRNQTRPPEERVRFGNHGTPLWNVRPEENTWILERKGDGTRMEIAQTPQDSNHNRVGHERLSCASCHATWAPTCSTCHTTFDPNGSQWDFSAGSVIQGQWIETNQGMETREPTLGVNANNQIYPAIPGMIADIHLANVGGNNQHLRLFSLLDPHTTTEQARSCESCHQSSWTIGTGSGTLLIEGTQQEQISILNPIQPSDAWTPLFPNSPGMSTRSGSRSLNSEEHTRILNVGYCLMCHNATHPLWELLQNQADLQDRWNTGLIEQCEGFSSEH